MRSPAARIEADIGSERARLDAVDIHGKQSQRDKRQDKQQHRQYGPAADWIVAKARLTGFLFSEIGRDGRWSAQEMRKTRGLRADKSPDDAKKDQREQSVAGQAMPIEMALLLTPPRKDHEWNEQPVKNAHRQIPDAQLHGRRVQAHSLFRKSA